MQRDGRRHGAGRPRRTTPASRVYAIPLSSGFGKTRNLILNLVALMIDAGIQDIQLEPDKAVWKVRRIFGVLLNWQVQEKFMLELSEEDAIKQFQGASERYILSDCHV